jgi:transposase-like protein
VSKTKEDSNISNQVSARLSQAEFHEWLYQLIRAHTRLGLERVMQEELNDFLNALPGERTEERRGYRNGYYQRDLVTGIGKLEAIQVPRDRAGGFETKVFEQYARNDTAVNAAITEMFFKGVSSNKVGAVTEKLMGISPSASTVSRLAHDLEAECEQWRNHQLAGHYPVIYLDGVYFPIVHEGKADQTALLVALGVREDGTKEVLAVEVGGEESEASWTELLQNLKKRGVEQIDLVVTDGDAGLISALGKNFPKAKRQRCVTHKMRNTLAKLPHRVKGEVAKLLKGIFASADRERALTQYQAFVLKYEKAYPEAVKSLSDDFEACLTYYQFDKVWWRYIRTNNVLESLFSVIRRRTNNVGAFRNEQSCLLLVYSGVISTKFQRMPVLPIPERE